MSSLKYCIIISILGIYMINVSIEIIIDHFSYFHPMTKASKSDVVM